MFLIHVENQATHESDFAERMFDYFALLRRKLKLNIYPVALMSWDSPLRKEPDTFEVAFPDRRVLWFQFTAIQLNRMDWRAFAGRHNPVAAALMAKMQILPDDRHRVKLECFRLLATLRLDQARSRMISSFVNRYLRLTAAEFAAYKREADTLTPPEREVVMVITNEFAEEGARTEALSFARLLLRSRFHDNAISLEPRLEPLSVDQLEQLGVALLTIPSVEDAEHWLDRTQLTLISNLAQHERRAYALVTTKRGDQIDY